MEAMIMVIQADPVPLSVDDHGTVRIGNSRVTLDVVLAEHKKGASPEAIAEEFDTLDLADIYAAIAYSLRHADDVAAYLQRRQEQAAGMRKMVEDAGMSSPELAAAMQKRWSEKE